MNIGLFFGSFNPIHSGHLIIANHILNETELDIIWLVVSPQNPFKSQAELLNEFDRLDLVKKAIAEDKRIAATDIEFSLPKPSYTITTLNILKDKFPSERFFVIMGGDSYQNLESWKDAEAIKKNYTIIIYRRPGFPIDEQPNTNKIIVDAPLIEISSTKIRALIQEKKSIRYLVPDAVRKEIEEKKFYQ